MREKRICRVGRVEKVRVRDGVEGRRGEEGVKKAGVGVGGEGGGGWNM
jgi:hypothetical protein